MHFCTCISCAQICDSFFFPGMIDAGMGATHVNAFLTAVNIPPIPPKTLKSHERYVGKKIEAAAQQSCQDAIMLEKYV